MNLIQNNQSSTLHHLEALISFDSRNPPRQISTESPIFKYLMQNLPGFSFQFVDAGDGCIALLASRGQPDILFNFHIDTVPVADNWSLDPFKLTISEGKAYGLGACDIKGASACMLSAVNQTSGDVALLFSSDEEHGSSAAVKAFLKTEHGFNQVVVAEPTLCQAVVAHRGIQSANVTFSGISAHASEQGALDNSAIHKAVDWSSAVIKWVKGQTQKFRNLHGMPFNIGKIDGGIKANMIAASCHLSIGFRPLPGQDSISILAEMANLYPSAEQTKNSDIQINPSFTGPTLPAANQDFSQSIKQSEKLAGELGLPVGPAVNFWTEASLFSEAGLSAIVFGPGNIQQAHTADEWVSLEQLEAVENHYKTILNHDVKA